MKTIQLPMRFRGPYLYPIIFGLAFLVCSFLGIYFLLDATRFITGIILLGVAALAFLYFYGNTKTILVDSNGIALCSLLGERKRFSWAEIARIRSRGIFIKGIKVYNQQDELISIDATTTHYDLLIETIRQMRTDLWVAPSMQDQPEDSPQGLASSSSVLYLQKPAWRLWGALLFAALVIAFFIFGITRSNWTLSVIFISLWFFGGFPVLVYISLKNPKIILVDGDTVTIEFFSSKLIKPVRWHVSEITRIEFKNQIDTYHDGAHASNEVILWSNDGRKISLTGFKLPNEGIYFKLKTWREQRLRCWLETTGVASTIDPKQT